MDISYYSSWKEGSCIEKIHGIWEESYSQLSFYVVQLLDIDLATQRHLVHEIDGLFLGFFLI